MSNILSLEEMTRAMRVQFGWDDARAEDAARKTLGLPMRGAPITGATIAMSRLAPPRRDGRVIDRDEIDRLEKDSEHAGDKIVLAINGKVIRFSHPGKTKQTPGIADRIYGFRWLRLAVWWEWKTPDNEQSPAQLEFEDVITACGHEYQAGGLGDFKVWLAAHGVVAGFNDDGTPIPIPHEAR